MKFFALVAFCILCVNNAYGRPYFGDAFTFYQPDGQEFQVRLFGDEFYVVVETLDGYTLTKDIATGFYCYAEPAPDGLSFRSTGIKSGEPIPAGLQLKKNIRLSRTAIKERSDAARKKFGVDSKGRLLPSLQLRLRPQDFGYQRWTPALEQEAQEVEEMPLAAQPAPPSNTTTGTRIGLVLLAQFPDRPDDVTLTQAQVDAFTNDPSYTEFGNATSVYGYFDIQSNGRLQYNCIVTSYFTAAQNRSYYTDNAISYPVRAKELINEGLAALEAKGFDFTRADGNSDGVLDGVNLFYAGSRTNNWMEGLWPHKSQSSWSELENQGLSNYFYYQITDMTEELTLGTFCHENGHMLCDFPDLYSYNGNAARLNTYWPSSSYTLMASSGMASHPSIIDPYLKIHAGWVDIIDLNSTSHLRGAVEADGQTAYRFKNPSEPREYFLLSARGDSGYEGVYGGSPYAVNPTDGLVIWHAREHGSNTYGTIFTGDSPVDYSTPYELMVVEATPQSTTTPWYDAPYPGGDDAYRNGGVDEASDFTAPALKFWNTSTGRTVTSNMHVHSVNYQGDVVTFTVGSGAVSTAPAIGLTKSSLAQSVNYGANGSPQTFSIFNSGGGTLNYSVSDNASWLAASTTSGTSTTEAEQVTVSYNTSGLDTGTYHATITVTDSGASNSPRNMPVSLTVHSQALIVQDPIRLTKKLLPNQQATDSFVISNGGGGTLYYTLAEAAEWLELETTSGTVATEYDDINLYFDTSGLTAGIYSETIWINSGNALNSPMSVPVTLIIDDQYEYNNYISFAYDLSQYPDTWLHTIEGLGIQADVDWYKIEVTSEDYRRIYIEVAFDHDQGNISLYLQNEDRSFSDRSDSFSDNESLDTMVPTVGTYYVAVWQGDAGNSYDLWWNDDWSSWDFFPDLLAKNPRVSTATPVSGDSFTAYATVENQGAVDAAENTSLRFYSSADAIINTDDIELALTTSSSPLAAGATSEEMSATVTAPATPGSYWIGACVATDNERNTGNQCSPGVPITVSGQPDLYVSALSVSNSALTPGQSFTIYSAVKNQGTEAADSTVLHYHRSSDSTVNFEDTQLGTDSVGSLGAGQYTQLSLVTTAPDTPGDYWVGACLETVTDESNTNNQCSAGVKVTVSSQPDLYVSALSVSNSALTPGQSFTIYSAVKNQGTEAAGSTVMHYHRSSNSTISFQDTQLGVDTVGSLGAGQYTQLSLVTTAPDTPGDYWVGACLETVTNESNTNNQCSTGVKVTVSGQPDLYIKALSVGDSTLKPGQKFTIYSAVKNQGDGDAAKTALHYHQSTNSTISYMDDHLAVETVPALDAGQWTQLRYEVTAPDTTGDYWVGACLAPVSDESDTSNQCSRGVKVSVEGFPWSLFLPAMTTKRP